MLYESENEKLWLTSSNENMKITAILSYDSSQILCTIFNKFVTEKQKTK